MTEDDQIPDAWTMDEQRYERLTRYRREAARGGGQDRIDSQHEKGKRTARERIDYLLDDALHEIGPLARHQRSAFGLDDQRAAGDAVITGHGEIDGRKAFVYALDFTVLGGSVGEVVAEKICTVLEMADDAIASGSPDNNPRKPTAAEIEELYVDVYDDVLTEYA